MANRTIQTAALSRARRACAFRISHGFWLGFSRAALLLIIATPALAAGSGEAETGKTIPAGALLRGGALRAMFEKGAALVKGGFVLPVDRPAVPRTVPPDRPAVDQLAARGGRAGSPSVWIAADPILGARSATGLDAARGAFHVVAPTQGATGATTANAPLVLNATQILGWSAASFNWSSFNMISSYMSQTSVNKVEEVWIGPTLVSGTFVRQIRATIFTYKDTGQGHSAYVSLTVYVINPSTGGTVTLGGDMHTDLNAESTLVCDVNRYVDSNNYIICKLKMFRETNTDVTEFHTLEVDTTLQIEEGETPEPSGVRTFNMYSKAK